MIDLLELCYGSHARGKTTKVGVRRDNPVITSPSVIVRHSSIFSNTQTDR